MNWHKRCFTEGMHDDSSPLRESGIYVRALEPVGFHSPQHLLTEAARAQSQSLAVKDLSCRINPSPVLVWIRPTMLQSIGERLLLACVASARAGRRVSIRIDCEKADTCTVAFTYEGLRLDASLLPSPSDRDFSGCTLRLQRIGGLTQRVVIEIPLEPPELNPELNEPKNIVAHALAI